MIELPNVWRKLLVDSLDDYCASLDGTSDADEIAEAVVEQIEVVAAEAIGVEAEGIVSRLEESMEADGGLVEVLGARLNDDDLESVESGEVLLRVIEALCEIEYLTSDDDDDDETAGFFDTSATYDEDDEF
jgi:hypothetical protein